MTPIGIDREGNENNTDIGVIGNETVIRYRVKCELKIQVKRLYNKMKQSLKKREKTVRELRYGDFLNRNKQDTAARNCRYARNIQGQMYHVSMKKAIKKNSARSLSRKAADKAKGDVGMTSVPFLIS
jgi:RNA polymerase sporulation-specific sigma factor